MPFVNFGHWAWGDIHPTRVPPLGNESRGPSAAETALRTDPKVGQLHLLLAERAKAEVERVAARKRQRRSGGGRTPLTAHPDPLSSALKVLAVLFMLPVLLAGLGHCMESPALCGEADVGSRDGDGGPIFTARWAGSVGRRSFGGL